jgi:hypothetical protein
VTTPPAEGGGAPVFRHWLLQQAQLVRCGECFSQRLRHDHEPHRNRRKSNLFIRRPAIPLGREGQPHSDQVWVVGCSGTSRHPPPPRIRDFHVSMVLRSDQPASRTLFAMSVGAIFDGLTLPAAINPYCRTSVVFPCAENPSGCCVFWRGSPLPAGFCWPFARSQISLRWPASMSIFSPLDSVANVWCRRPEPSAGETLRILAQQISYLLVSVLGQSSRRQFTKNLLTD